MKANARIKTSISKKLMDKHSKSRLLILTLAVCVGIALLAELVGFNVILRREVFYFSWNRFLAVFVILTVAFILIAYHRYFLQHLEKAFLLISIPIGVLFILIFPKTVYVSPDDQIHLQQAYIFLNPSDVSWSEAFRMLELQSTKVDQLSLTEIDALYDQLNNVHETTKNQRADFAEVSKPYTRLVYLPFFIGFKISQFLGVSFTSMIIIAKLCNFLCYVCLLFFAIKISTHAQKIFFILALFVSNMFYASQFSYDPTITASLMLAIALFLRMLELPRIAPHYVFAFILLIVWASLPKAVYCPIMLLLMFVPNNKFNSYRQAIACKVAVGCLTLLLASTFVLPTLLGDMSSDVRGGDTNVGRQIAYILQNPLHFILTFANFTAGRLSGLMLTQPIIESYLPYDYTKYVLPIINLTTIIVLGYAIFASLKPTKIYTNKICAVLIIVYLIAVYAIVGALYLSFTPVGDNTVQGFQGRYLLPILPLALVFLMPRTKSTTIKEKNSFAIIAIPFLSLAVFLGCFILRISII